ncbi:MAG: hypothetical protein LBG72_08560 [Spirochaetaceae bacterium]|jgi:hypothetical protein|nr:hypothetical protein [Spirochaetaceae bacterium]
MKKFIHIFTICAFIFALDFGCSSPVSQKKGSGGNEEDPIKIVDPDEEETYSPEQDVIKVKLKSDGTTSTVSVQRGVVIVGKYGFSSTDDKTVWIEELDSQPASPDAVNLIPSSTSQTFIPWDNLPSGYTSVEIIENKTQLQQIEPATSSDKIFVLAKDIDVGGAWGGTNAIGTYSNPFMGWFTGGGHYIKNIRLSSGNTTAIFGSIKNARIDTLRIILSSSDEIKDSGDTMISPLAARIIGTNNTKTTIKRIAVSMDKTKNTKINIGPHADGNFIYFGGIAASIENEGETLIEECAVSLAVTADTGFAKSDELKERISVGGIVGDISKSGKVIIRNCSSLGKAEITGKAPEDSSSNSYNYPKFAGGIVGFIGSAPDSQDKGSVSAIYNNFIQFDIEITGGTKVNPQRTAEIFRAANGVIGAKSKPSDAQPGAAYVSVYGNFVATKTLSCNNDNIKGIMFNKQANDGALDSYCLNKAVEDGSLRPNFVWDSIKLINNDGGEKTIPVPSTPSDIFNGKATESNVIIDNQSLIYYNAQWDMDNAWQMAYTLNTVIYRMSDYKGMQTDKKKNYGGYPYPTPRWLGLIVPAPIDFSPIEYPQYDSTGYDAEGYNPEGFYKEPPNLNRDGYDKYGIYGGTSEAESYYIYDSYTAQNEHCTMKAPGFRWDNDNYYKPDTPTTMILGDWTRTGSDFSDIPVPYDYGDVNDGRSKPAAGKPCPWVDIKPADGFHDALGFDKNGFKQGTGDKGINIFGYRRDGVHVDGYDNPGTIGGSSYSTGFDIFGLPCPWIDTNPADGYNDITGLDANWQPKP